MQKGSKERRLCKLMFLDFIRDFNRKYPIQNEDSITLAEIMDFVDVWVDQHFKDDEDKNAGS